MHIDPQSHLLSTTSLCSVLLSVHSKAIRCFLDTMEPLALITGLWDFFFYKSQVYPLFLSHFLPPVYPPTLKLPLYPSICLHLPRSMPRHLAALLLLYSQVGTTTVGFKHEVPVSLLLSPPTPSLSLFGNAPFLLIDYLWKEGGERGMRGRWSTLLLLLLRAFLFFPRGGCASFISL